MMTRNRLVLAIAAALVAVPVAAQNRPPLVEKVDSALPWLKLEELNATRDRPLFAANRRPPAPPPPPPAAAPVATATPAPPPKPQLSLRGIIVQRSTVLVVLQDANTSKSVVVRPGERVGPWRVTLENEHSVKLADGSEDVHLDMYEEKRAEP